MKKEKMEGHTIRLPVRLWWKIMARAAADKTGNTTPSDVVRLVLAQNIEKIRRPRKNTR